MDYIHEKLPLKVNKANLYLIREKLSKNVEELESFLENNYYTNSEKFASNVLFSHEIKANNNIEGYNDDVGLVCDVLDKDVKIKDKEKEQRIRNLYNGYKYIYERKDIDKDSFKKLYSILSENLLGEADIKNMGEFYRLNPVYIFYSSNMCVSPDLGIDASKIDEYMDEYFKYINSNNNFSNKTEYFIKSQIMHFQLVNIHPYYNINGRISRTAAMWYLLNNNVYPYLIFNRGINFNISEYYKIIRDVKKYRNITYFLNYMLDNVKIELEKEYIMNMIKSCSSHLNAVDYQTMYYILSMNGLFTVKDFINFYNRYNDKKSGNQIYNDMIVPLLDKGIILKVRDTNSYLNSTDSNFVFELNKSKYEVEPSKIKRLKLN